MDPTTRPRSPFVNGIAIVGICLGSFLFLSEIVSTGSMLYMLNSSEYRTAMDQMRRYAPSMRSLMPDPTVLLAEAGIGMLLDAALAVASVGLLLRREWGRIALLWIVWVQVAYSLVGAVRNLSMATSAAGAAGLEQALGGSTLSTVAPILTAFSVFLGFVVAAMVTWKLRQPHVREEFNRT
jgi:hypothetical protein